MQKMISEPINRPLNARALHKINADANNAHLVRQAERSTIVGQALRLPTLRSATGAVALQFCGNVRYSSGILSHRGEHFFHGGFEPDPHRARDDGVANVELGQRRNLMDERDIFVIDAVTDVNLQT